MKWRFIHVPKTGGTSIRSVYGQGPMTPNRNDVPDTPHLPSSYFNQYEGPMFAVLREPYERVLSLCAFIHRKDGPLTMSTFNRWCEAGFQSDVVPGTRLMISAPQHHWITRHTVVLLYSQLDWDVKRIMLPIIDSPWIDIPHSNQSRYDGDDAKALMTPITKNLVYQHYKQDFKLYDKVHGL